MGIVIDQIAADKYTFDSTILSKNECDEIKRGLGKIEQYHEKVQYILNFYHNNKKLRFIRDSGVYGSLVTMFVRDKLWVGYLIFEEMQ